MEIHRRAFLLGAAGAAVLGGGSFAYMTRWGRQIDPGPHPGPYEPRAFAAELNGPAFDPRAVKTLTALVDRLLPPAAGLPGGLDAGVMSYLSWALVQPGMRAVRAEFLKLSRSLDMVAKQQGLADFAAGSAEAQDALIAEAAAGRGARGNFKPARALRSCLRLCLEGYLSNPSHGGNKGALAWKALQIHMPENAGPFDFVPEARP